MTEEGTMVLMILCYVIGWISHWAYLHSNDDISITS